MKRLTIPSGRECDALPSGEYACWLADGSAVQTHFGLVPTVKGIVPRFVRLTKVGGFQFAGQANQYGPEEGPCVTWHEVTGWAFLATVPCGTSPVIYDRNGNLHVSNCGPGIGSQGFRYVDYVTGRIVPGDETISSPVGLSEWIDLGDGILVGLGNVVNGCTIWDGHDLRMLEPGDNQFIRAQRDGDQVSVAMARYHGEPSVIIWTTMAELRALPIVAAPPTTREPIVKIGRPILLGWVTYGTPNPPVPSNCTLAIGGKEAYITAPDGTKLAKYLQAGSDSDVDALEALIEATKKGEPHMPRAPYWTRTAQTVRVPKDSPDVAVECFWYLDETLEQCEARIRAALRRCERPIIVAQDHTSNPKLQKDIAALVPMYARVAAEETNVQGILPFSAGPGRITGWDDHPEVWDLWRELAAGIPKDQAPAPKPPVTPPVTPTPKPTPAPVVPPTPPHEEHLMPFYLLDKPLTAAGYEVLPQGDGVALKRADGKFMEVDAFGQIKFVDSPNDGDAKFKRGKTGGLVAADRGGDKKCFVIEGVEA